MHKTRSRKTGFKICALAVMVISLLRGMAGCDRSKDIYEPYRNVGVPFIKAIDPHKGISGDRIGIIGEFFGTHQGKYGKVHFYGGENGAPVEAVVEGWTDTVVFAVVPTLVFVDKNVPVEIVRQDGIKTPYKTNFLVLKKD